MVVLTSRSPSSSWTVRISWPSSSRCVANEWRRVWGLPPGVRVLLEQGGRQFDPAGPGGQVTLMLGSDDVEVPREVRLGDAREHGDPVLVALAAADDDLVGGEVDVLDAEPAALEHPEPGTVEQAGHEARHAVEPLEHGANLLTRENDGEPLGALRAHDAVEPREIGLADAVEEAGLRGRRRATLAERPRTEAPAATWQRRVLDWGA